MNNFIRTIYEILYNFLGDSRRKSWFLGDFRRNIELIVGKILTIQKTTQKLGGKVIFSYSLVLFYQRVYFKT